MLNSTIGGQSLTNTKKPPIPPIVAPKISGYVYSREGTTLKGAKVTCSGNETTTLANGFFAFTNIPDGTHKVEVRLQGFKPQAKTVLIQEGKEISINFRMSKTKGKTKICGYVYDAESKKPIVRGGTVQLILPVANKYAHIDRNGYYEFKDLLPNTYKIVTSIRGYEDGSATVSVADDGTSTHDFFLRAMNVEEPPWG